MTAVDDFPFSRPAPMGLSADWYRWLARDELHFQRCDDCTTWRHPPRVLCGSCGSPAWSWQASTRRGRIFSWTVTHQPLHPAFAAVVPYAIVVVELDEGPRVVCNAPTIALGDLALDLAVEIRVRAIDDELGLPYAVVAGQPVREHP